MTVAGHTGRVVIEPVGSTDSAAALWLRPTERPADCVWLTGPQLRELSQLAAATADWLAQNAPYVAAITAHADPAPEPPTPSWAARTVARIRSTLTPTGARP